MANGNSPLAKGGLICGANGGFGSSAKYLKILPKWQPLKVNACSKFSDFECDANSFYGAIYIKIKRICNIPRNKCTWMYKAFRGFLQNSQY